MLHTLDYMSSLLICSTSVQQPVTPDIKSLRSENVLSPGTIARATTSTLTTLSLEKPLPATPDERNEAQDDVLMPDFEGYLDILAYLQRGLPSKPEKEKEVASEKEGTPEPVQTILTPAPKEEEWMSTARPSSQTSSYKTASASSDELRRLRSRTPSSAPTRCTSVSENTVTPKSSRESEWGARGGKPSLPGLGFASRIEEVSEPGTSSPVLTSDPPSTLMCYHCGRDPTGKDAKDPDGTPTTVLDIAKFNNFPEDDSRKHRGPMITAEDSRGQKYALYPETSYFKVLDKQAEEGEMMPKTPDNEEFLDFSTPVDRPSNPDPYATSTYSSPEDFPKQRQQVEIEIEDTVEVFDNAENDPPPPVWTVETPLSDEGPGPDACPEEFSESASCGLEQNDTAGDGGQFEAEESPDRSFWKNPEGVILVYQGVEVGGTELVYGADINYLGSFYDDDEGSSGLGSNGESSHDLVGTGTGLAMIPECGSSDDLWDDEAFESR